jgi:predicted extracellular nuclease
MRSRDGLVFRAALGATAVVALASCEGARPDEGVGIARLALDADPQVVIRQVYGGGSNAGAPFTHDFVELFNRSGAPASLDGWSLQYASATGTGNLGATAGQLTELPSVVLAPGQSFLVQQSGGTVGAPLPTPDWVDPTPIAMGATAGKVALVRQATTVGCNGSNSPCGPAQEALIVDLVGWGNANYAETAAAPTAGNATAVLRVGGGCVDSNNNASDFVVATPEPHNTATPAIVCGGGGGGGGAGGQGGSGGQAGAGTGGAGTGGAPEPGSVRIHDIQGAAHRSPLAGVTVTNVPGIVTVVRSNGFVMQDPLPDASDATSEGIFVFTSTAPAAQVGDSVLVSGPVAEFRPGCSGSCPPSSDGYTNLTTTEIDRPAQVIVVAAGNPLPAATLVGPGGRVSPAAVIDDDGVSDVEMAAATFSPDSDGIDFYESLEAMRVEIRDAVVVGPTNSFNEIPVLAGGGVGAGLRTARGGVVVAPGDFNPERIFLDGASMPAVNVGDVFTGSTFAVVDYSFGNFKFDTTALAPVVSAGLAREVVSLGPAAADQLNVAAFNVENLDPSDPPSKFASLAAMVVSNLGAPDLLALEEVQDDNGATNDAVVSAEVTVQTLVSAIQAAGGPTYQWRMIDPVDDQDGGEPGGNIRVAFLFRTDRGLTFVDRPGGGSTTPNTVVNSGGVPALGFSPGRIDPANPAFNSSRKPLTGEFRFNGRTFFAIANHFNSKGGDQPLFGRLQPPTLSSETQRLAQANVVAGFVGQLKAVDPTAAVIVLGDLNDFEFSAPVGVLKAAGLTSLVETLPANERYTYVFEGNSQVLDHVMVTSSLLSTLAGFDIVHANSEFAVQVSDHDPAVARFTLHPLAPLPVAPILECVARSGLSWTARFGYNNPNAFAVTLPLGAPVNLFLPFPGNRGQPTVFQPGRQHDVFQVSIKPAQPALWVLDGWFALATIFSPRCVN